MRKYTLGLIFSICLVDSVYAGFYQFGGSSNIGTGTAGQVLLTGSTGTTQWGENEILSSWYLPSIAEFAEMYAQKDIIGSFSGYYWTSNEISANNAIYKLMDDGSTGQQSKLFTCGVRAIRSFDTTYFAGKYLIGDTLGNGKVFYIDATGKKGLICSLVDQSNAAWGSQIIVATNDGIYAGKNNSINIIDVNGTISTAAKICRDYAPSSSSGGSGSGGGAPTDATYITQVSHGSLTAGQALGSLSTGIMKNTTGTGIVSVAIAGTDFVAPNIAVVDATKTKISYDTKGLVTAGADATTADIADSVDKRYCTDVQKTVIGNTSGINTGDQNLSGKQDFIATGTTGQYYRGDKTFQTLDNAAVGLGNVTNNAQYYAGGADVAIADGGTGQSSAQLAINTLTNVEAAMNEQVLTKDTTSGNVIFKDASGGVSSFNTRTGAVVPATNDYTWAQVNKATSNIADIATKSHTSLTDIGNNNHAAIDTFVSSKAAASGLASLDADSKVVQDPVNAVVTPAAGKIPIADGSGKLNGWVTATIPAGATGQIQFNDNGAFAGHEGLSYNHVNNQLTIGTASSGVIMLSETSQTPAASEGFGKLYIKSSTAVEYVSDVNTSLLLHGNGTGATFVDSGNNPKVITTFGAATQSTTQSKMGGKSIYFPGASGDYLEAATSADFDFGAEDFTIDFWFYTSSSSRQWFVAASSDYHFGIDYSYQGGNSRKVGIYASSTGSNWNILTADYGGNGRGTIALPLNTWNHIAFVRNNAQWMLFINGVLDLNVTATGAITSINNENVRIGKHGSEINYMVNGYIDEFRVSKGIARWTTNFIPGSDGSTGLYFKNSSGTEFLLSH